MPMIMAEELNLQEFDERNLKALCPFHEEHTPSFVYNRKNYTYKCFGCGKSVDLIDVYQSKGFTFTESVQKLFELAGMQYSFGEHHVKTMTQYRYPTEVPLNDKKNVYAYLALRKISPATVDYLDIREDSHGNLVFNYYDTNDTLTMVKYRPSHKINKEAGENKNWCQPGADTCPILYNINRINTSQPLLICSGELDCAAAVECGWTNAVSIPLGDGNTQWVDRCWDWLEQFDSIIIAADNDESGEKYLKGIIPRLGSWRCKTMQIPRTYKTEDGVVHKIKDVNEALLWMGKAAVYNLILSAKDNPIPSVIDMSEVKAKDYSSMPGVETGIVPIDKELMRLFYGTLTVLTGLPGSGKSSILCQIVANALDNGVNTWMFSGELPEYMEKSWHLYVMAGPRNVNQYQSKEGDFYYRVKDGVEDAIDEEYRGRWFLYRDDYDKDMDSLMEAMICSARKYGSKLFILDNFMTIDIGNTDDELKEQTNVVKRLIDFSKKYDVATILVCHPRKIQKNTNVGIQDISGTSNIVNLAHRTLSMRKINEEEKIGVAFGSTVPKNMLQYDVVVSIIKDRIRGRSGKLIGMYYDPPSRRFYTTNEEYDKQYNWDKTQYDTPLTMPYRDPPGAEQVFGETNE